MIGRETSLVVEATDTRAPVSGMTVQFGRGRRVRQQRLPARRLRRDHPARVPAGDAQPPGRPPPVPQEGRQKVLVRVDSGGCLSPLSSFYQAVTVTPTSPARGLAR